MKVANTMLSKWDHITLAAKRLPRPKLLRRSAKPLMDGHVLFLQELGRREKIGEIATLRDAHLILNLPQSKALKLAYELEYLGLVEIDKETFDRLSSLVALTEKGQRSAGMSNAA